MVTIVRVVAELMQLAEGTGTGAREAMTLGRVHSWPRRCGTVRCLRASRTAAASSADAPHRQTQVPRVLRSVASPCITIALRTCRCKSLRTVRHPSSRCPDEVHLPRMLRDRREIARREEDARSEHVADDERDDGGHEPRHPRAPRRGKDSGRSCTRRPRRSSCSVAGSDAPPMRPHVRLRSSANATRAVA